MSQEFRGTSQAQDSRFANKEQSLLRSTKFPPNFSTRVDVSKCDLKVIRTWVEHQILKILGVDDEVVTEYLMEALEGERYPDPKKIQINMTGFLEKKTPTFMSSLWDLLISAQDSIGGIPAAFLDKAKQKILEQKLAAERSAAEQRDAANKAKKSEEEERDEHRFGSSSKPARFDEDRFGPRPSRRPRSRSPRRDRYSGDMSRDHYAPKRSDGVYSRSARQSPDRRPRERPRSRDDRRYSDSRDRQRRRSSPRGEERDRSRERRHSGRSHGYHDRDSRGISEHRNSSRGKEDDNQRETEQSRDEAHNVGRAKRHREPSPDDSISGHSASVGSGNGRSPERDRA